MTAAAPPRLGGLGQLDGHGRAAVGGADHHREAARGGAEEGLGHPPALGVGELSGLAHDPQHVQAVDPAPGLPLDQGDDALLVHPPPGVEGGGGDGNDAGQARRHGFSRASLVGAIVGLLASGRTPV
jgi:hypothetical protein